MRRKISMDRIDELVEHDEIKRGRAQKVNSLQEIKREAFIEKLLLDNRPDRTIEKLAEETFGMTRKQVYRLKCRIQARWERDHEERRKYYKLAAMYRIHDLIAAARSKERFGDALNGEKLLAQIQGTLEPMNVSVEFTFKQAIADYLSNLTEDELTVIEAEYEEIKSLPEGGED